MRAPVAAPPESRRAAAPAAAGPRAAPPVPDALGAGPGAAPRVGCACGGGCPRCAGGRGAPPVLPAAAPGDAREREAELAAERAVRGPAADPEVSAGLAVARVHADARAARAAAALGARAFAVGRDVVFGAGQFRPDTRAGRRLIAHELAHVAQQERDGRPAVQRQPAGAGPDVTVMDPITITGTLQPTERAVANLDRLRGQGADPDAMALAHGDADVQRNAPDPARRLPFADGGWDAQAILTALGQYDTIPGTDSDAVRCVQAVAMASRVVDGPAAVAGFLGAMILEGMMSRPMNPRERAAVEVLRYVAGRLGTARATFGDLLWAQEALHDLFYNDVSGTPEPDVRGRIAPAFEMGRTLTRMNVWCNGPQDVMREAERLQPGEHLIVNTWQVVFNSAFDQLAEQGVEVAEGRSTVAIVNGRRVRLRRIRTDARPAHTAIDPTRDSRSGHQLIVMKDGATGALRLYEPEITPGGQHLETLAADGSNFGRYFADLPDVGIYHYIQILGKLTPAPAPSSLFTAP